MRQGNVSLENIFFSREEMTNLDGVFIPTILDYGFLPPMPQYGLNFYSASIEYRVALFDKGGAKVGEWIIGGYGKTEGTFSRKKSVNRATDLAISDAAARIALEIMDKPEVRVWINSMSNNTNPID